MRSNTLKKVNSAQDAVNEAIAVLTKTTPENVERSLDELARILLEDRYSLWVKNYGLMHKRDWFGHS